jgi:PadR family transcriptional regulator PadR
MMDREFTRGFIKLYSLWRTSQAETFGTEIMEEMRRLGFKVSPGTLYPTLHALLEEKDITQTSRTVNGKVRKYYKATAKGRKEAREVIKHLSLLLDTVFKEES